MLTADRLRELLEYDPDSGLWVWIGRDNNRCPPGKIAGTVDKKGYVVIQVDGRFYKAHRLAWLYMIDVWPKNQIDHINLVKADNRWVNLREATRSQNGANRLAPINNTSGFKGVVWNKTAKKWEAAGYATIFGVKKRFYLGVYPTKEEASEVYRAWAKETYGEFAREQ